MAPKKSKNALVENPVTTSDTVVTTSDAVTTADAVTTSDTTDIVTMSSEVAMPEEVMVPSSIATTPGINPVLEGMRDAFKMCAPRKASSPTTDTQVAEGATFYAIFPANLPRTEGEFKDADYMFLSPYMVQPIAPGRALAPHEYARGSKKSKEQLMAFNKSGLPLTAWADSSHSSIRFWGCEKKGFNRGNRVDDLTWTYGGGHTMNMCINLKVIQISHVEWLTFRLTQT